MLEKIENALLYYGVGWINCNYIKTKINEANRNSVKLVSGMSIALMGAMYIMTLFVEGIKKNQMVYLIGVIASILIFVISVTFAKAHKSIVIVLAGLVCSVIYIYGIMIGTITDPTQKTVTFMAALVFLPILFTSPSIAMGALSYVYVAIFIALCFKCKTGAVLANDVIDAIIFGTLGCVSGSVVSKVRVQGYLLEHKLQEISQIDPLTKMKNRYSYELNLDKVPDICKRYIGCIYIDVNGLHNLNNTKGHQAGDTMLKFVADQIKTTFGSDFSFRIGGDEFIVFIVDPEESEVEKALADMSEVIEHAGYHIASGIEIRKIRHLNTDSLIKSAEIKMYRNKTRYYEENNEVRI